MSVAEPDVKKLFRYRFGSAEFDETRFELRVAGLAVRIERKPLEVLALLLQHAGEVVTKDEMLTTVWAGRPSVEAVITNALTKLRDSLGEDNAAQIVTQPRVGYRLTGTVERIVVGRAMTSRIQLSKGAPVPLRANFQLESLLNSSRNSEVWVARSIGTNERRVYKFSSDGERLSTLKREVTLHRLLKEALGERDDMVHILDWNFETSPFFIECEFGGDSLSEWANKDQTLQQLTQSQRIELFLQIADAVAAAHDVGVLHKDIKPANILIAPRNDTTWQIRLTDFGSGRLLDPQRIQELGITQLGLTLTTAIGSADYSGTLLYLAPELMTHQAPTIQSDIYALGMILYQLLIGDLRKPLVPGWERDIDDELLRDDIRVATEGNPAHRLNSVHALVERLRTLDARHLHLQQERLALSSANQLRDALKRAEARRPWVMVAGALLLVGLATSSWLYARAIRVQHQLLQSQAQTSQQAARAEAINEFWNNEVLGAADPFAATTTSQRTIKDVMTRAANNLDGKFNNDPLTEAAIRMKLGDIFSNMADGAAAELQFKRSATVLMEAGIAASPQLLKSRYGLAHALLLQSKFDQAAAELAEADQLRLQRGVDDPQTMEAAHLAWGIYFYDQQQTELAVPHFEEALRILKAQPIVNIELIDDLRVWLGDAYISVNRLKEAESMLHDVVDNLVHRNASELTLAIAKGLYGASLLYQHRYQAAEPLIEQSYQATVKIFGKIHPNTIDALALRCDLYSLANQREKTLQCRQRSYEMTRTVYGTSHWSTLSALVDLGAAQYALNRYAQAVHSLESATADLTRLRGTDKYSTQIANYYLARCLIQLHKDIDYAQSLVQPLDPKVLKIGEPNAPWALRIQLLRGMVLLSQGKRSEALVLLQPASQLHDDADPTDNILQEAQLSLRAISMNNEQHLVDINQ